MPDFTSFYESFLLRGLEQFRKYYGLYRGTVVRNDDPERRGRIQAKVPQVGHSSAPDVWIDPAFDGAGSDRGSFYPPEIGDSVKVSFSHGDPSKPATFLPGWFGGADLPEEFAYTAGQKVTGQTGTVSVPERRGFVTRKGHSITFSDEDGKESVELTWHRRSSTDESKLADNRGDRSKSADRETGDKASLVFNSDGDVIITNIHGSKLSLNASTKNIVVRDEHGNTLTMHSGGVTIETPKAVIKATQTELSDGADTPAMRGRETELWLKTHTHSTPWGPTGTPIVPPPPNILSKNVKLR